MLSNELKNINSLAKDKIKLCFDNFLLCNALNIKHVSFALDNSEKVQEIRTMLLNTSSFYSKLSLKKQ